MRIKEEIDCFGKFWLPEQSYEQADAGRLTIKEGGAIELEIMDNFNRTINGFEYFLEGKIIPLIYGKLNNGKLITLEKCQYIKSYHIQALFAYIRTDLFPPTNEPIRIDECSFQLEGLSQLLGHYELETDGNKAPKYENIFSTPLANGFTLEIAYFQNTRLTNKEENEQHIKGNYKCIIKSDKEHDVYKFISYYQKFAFLISFLIADIASVYNFCGKNKQKSYEVNLGDNLITQIPSSDIYFQTLIYTKNSPEHIHSKILISKNHIYHNFQNILEKWLIIYDAAQPAIKLYTLQKTFTRNILESHFLALAQALENLARHKIAGKIYDKAKFKELREKAIAAMPDEETKLWLECKMAHMNEISLKERLKKLCEPICEIIEPEKLTILINDIVDTRNYLTHYDKKGKKKAQLNNDLFILNSKTKILFEILIMLEIGFKVEELNNLPGVVQSHIETLNT